MRIFSTFSNGKLKYEILHTAQVSFNLRFFYAKFEVEKHQ